MFRKSDANDSATPALAADSGAVAEAAPAKPIQAGGSAGQNGNGNFVQIPLATVIAMMPIELRGRVRHADVTSLMMPVPADKVLAQLSSGVVKVSFGEIRNAMPQVFAPNPDRDQTQVILPLGEILSRINPSLLARRPVQKSVEIPAEITSPFGGHGQGLVFSVGKAKTEPTPAPKFTPPTPPVAATPVVPMTPITPIAPSAPRARNSLVPSPSAVPEQIFQRATNLPAAASKPAVPITPISPIAATPVAPTPALRPKDPLSFTPVARSVRPASSEPVKPASPAAPAPTAPELPPLMISLSSVAQNWPEPLRQEIVQLDLMDARLALPTALVEAALKRGRVVFAWKSLRSWIRPATPANVSVHDATELELPLSVLAPVFVAHKNAGTKKQQRVVVDETIPNLFFGLPQPEPVTAPAPATPPVNKVVDTNYYVWDDVSDTARVDETEFKRKPSTGGTDFVVKYATPNEIVSRAAVLDGVAGVVIALPDGLMVASRIPPELNGDTLAAFLPQIFAKVSQTTKELRMGDLNNLNFTVGNIPWKIFRVNAIFFAAFGRVGEALPTAPLAALAAELDRKRQ